MRTDQRSPDAQAYRSWYSLAVWLRAREAQLAKQPLCELCLATKPSRVTPATVVNHRIPHKGDWALFIDPANFQSICAPHHDSLVQRQERVGYDIGCDTRGRPIAADHPWNARTR